MYLDERSFRILKEILISPGLKTKELEKKLNVNRKQIHYSIQKINDWLLENHLPAIQIERQMGLMVDRSIINRFPELINNKPTYDYIPAKQERIQLILLMVLGRKNCLSLYHFTSVLRVSKNTVLTDLDSVKSILKRNNLTLNYTRRDGYFIEGKEIIKRKLIIDLVNKILESSNGWKWIQKAVEISDYDIENLKQQLESVEKRLKTRFTDEQLNTLSIVLLILLRRAARGRHPDDYDIHFSDLSNTKEYQVVEELFGHMNELNEQDKLYIALQLLSSSVVTTEIHSEDFKESLYHSIGNFVQQFESTACVTFQNKEVLLEKLYQHLKPAFYRITYGLSMENPLLKQIKREFGEIHHLVKQCLDPLEEIFEMPMPEDEIAYLTLLITSSLKQQGDEIFSRPKAIVVCPNGISVSKLLFENLKQMFPEIIFLDHISVRDFQSYKLEYDIVFSTVFLQTNKTLFLIKPLFSDAEMRNLKLTVTKELKKISPIMINYDGLIEIIQKHADVHNPSALKEAVKTYFNRNQAFLTPFQEEIKPNLVDIIPIDFIQIKKTVFDWKEAIHLAAQPLLHSYVISSRYIDAMIKVIDEYGIFMIAPRVVIPHAKPEDGVHRLNMSVLTLTDAIIFPKDQIVQMLIVIAVADRKSHIKALTQLNNLLQDQNNVDFMIDADDPEAIHHLIQQYSHHLPIT
jgi:transcriptional antiterminator/mannitol/fructose-specific phosphotransferase system IIA component (Ntr-type)